MPFKRANFRLRTLSGHERAVHLRCAAWFAFNLCYTHSPSFPWGNLMRRRKFIAHLLSALVTWPVAARAQTVIRVRRIGVLSNSAEEDAEAAKRLAALKLRLQELGWIEGKNLQIEVRFGHNDGERIRRAATELIEVAPDRTVRLGRIEIPKQDFLTPDRQYECEHMMFNPWNCLEQHRPLGSINRMRLAVYLASLQLRQKLNMVAS